mgnify:CR=1 FL=1
METYVGQLTSFIKIILCYITRWSLCYITRWSLCYITRWSFILHYPMVFYATLPDDLLYYKMIFDAILPDYLWCYITRWSFKLYYKMVFYATLPDGYQIKHLSNLFFSFLQADKSVAMVKLEAAKPALESAEAALQTIKPAHISTGKWLFYERLMLNWLLFCIAWEHLWINYID